MPIGYNQYDRKQRRRGRYGRDTQASQWDFLWGGANRPRLNDVASLGYWGYSPSPSGRGGTTSFNPRQGTLGGIREVPGLRPIAGEWWNDNLVQSYAPGSGTKGALEKYRFNALSDMFKPRNPYASTGGAVNIDDRNRDLAKGGRGGLSTGGARDNFSERRGQQQQGIVGPETEIETETRGPIMHSRAALAMGTEPSGDLFQPLDPLSRAIRYAGQEGQLSAIGQYRALANRGILGPGGMQSILEQAEGPENAILDALPGRTAELLDYNKVQSADRRRRQLAGLGSQLGRTGVQRPGVAGAIAAGSAVPVNIAEADRAFGIQQSAYNTEDQINLGQGQRRAGLLEQNMRSKLAGVAGLGGRADQIAGILGSQFLDPTNPLQNQLNYQTNIMDQQFQNQRSLAGQQQGYTRINMQYQGYLDRLLSTNQINQQTYANLWLEQKYKELGLGNYNTDWSSYIDAFMPDTIAISSRRYKDNIESIDVGLKDTLGLRPVKFKWKDTGMEGVGFIAEEVAEVYPNLVVYDKQGRPDAVKYGEIITMLLLANRG